MEILLLLFCLPTCLVLNYDARARRQFYAHTCSYCKEMEDEFEKVAEDYKDDPIALVGHIECDTNGRDVCQHYGIEVRRHEKQKLILRSVLSHVQT
jgi:thiol-disulfide isomerase/thioredoxin